MDRRVAFLFAWVGLGVAHAMLYVGSAFVMMSAASHQMRFGGEMGWAGQAGTTLFAVLHVPLSFLLMPLDSLMMSSPGDIARWMTLSQWMVIGLHSVAWAAIVLLLGTVGWQRVTVAAGAAR
ncbi:MAG: hypothetical protein GVY15_03450 [Bacteroidetes bacterium]|jgi:hypothetical protein|nr:hypothetical protein [Bacteroidota bacterium]